MKRSTHTLLIAMAFACAEGDALAIHADNVPPDMVCTTDAGVQRLHQRYGAALKSESKNTLDLYHGQRAVLAFDATFDAHLVGFTCAAKKVGDSGWHRCEADHVADCDTAGWLRYLKFNEASSSISVENYGDEGKYAQVTWFYVMGR